ncbi:periplasmic sensor diguanylate cyclase/phosphodiesterase [Halothece sp. PCC 7418]|uniref:EAL domain-containing protein n=1 Tax=Halothece sp. (strain PCC 7418) TaxID=65093 RepID=UPI0002A08608|nr:EAL domain-containing protein [Halothece sp. PCC 7418]AFZ42848.1 periplasmic sensor diguanylate cyclase/phosphodiesterase [Halothece sp. PCC 7418]
MKFFNPRSQWARSPRHLLRRVHLPILATSCFAASVVIGARQLGQLQQWELSAFDLLVRSTTETTLDSRLLIVEIDEATIQQQQQWPLSDRAIAQAIQTLQQHQPKVIGLDLYRDLPQLPGREALLRELTVENVVTIETLNAPEASYIPAPPNVPETRVGFNDILIDPDNVVRRDLLYVQTSEQDFVSFALRLSLQYLDNPTLAVTPHALIVNNTEFPALEANTGGYVLETAETRGWQVLLNYSHQAPRLSFNDLLAGNYDPTSITGKIILIGTTAPSGKDLFLTPFSAGEGNLNLMSGVEVHAQMVSQILSTVLDEQPLKWNWSEAGEILWILGWSAVGGVLAWSSGHPLRLLGGGTVMLISNYGISWLLFSQGGWIPLIPSAIAFLLSGTNTLAYRVLYNNSYDSLTGLLNRNALSQCLTQMRQKQTSQNRLTLLCLDLGCFKLINDSFGPQASDQLLLIASERIRRCLQPTDFVARINGNQFAILLPSIANAEAVIKVANRLQQELQIPILLNQHQIHTNISIGAALNDPALPTDSETLIRNAHTAMNRAQESGSNHCTVYLEDMHDQVIYRLELEEDLRHAMQAKEFQLYYQPIVDLQNNKIAGFEALVRWHSRKRNWVYPSEFIPLAEETGLIVPLGTWILKEACQQMQTWQQKFPDSQHLSLSVNLSSRQFWDKNLIDQVQVILNETQFNPHCLKLEITESVIMQNMEETLKQLHAFKALGIQISIDDFGTGYSSLSYLHRLPIDTLKIDQSFIQRIKENWENSDIARTIVSLSHNLGLSVIAEGIETQFHLEFLHDICCEYGQGYLFSKPIPSQEVEDCLKAQNFEYNYQLRKGSY